MKRCYAKKMCCEMNDRLRGLLVPKYVTSSIAAIAIVVVVMLSLGGCALLSRVPKACRELRSVESQLERARKIAAIAHEADPNLVSGENLVDLDRVISTINEIANGVCAVGELVEK